ncbi:hypothetical protein Pse7367_2990 [Thalassoporum mexicanum PCC 7367]|uniref:hypothetical protein n=1 Tax=Thalassoporum mexicanum TaxID=3457544 RepID=UPI00029FFB8C|nr:hypothetical protein [Pseudanabaena sp. PCC 7367]AFY71241.1 hypothetical protein Pse7367_2990 [Pseudanabaena sp. PCC 7367]
MSRYIYEFWIWTDTISTAKISEILGTQSSEPYDPEEDDKDTLWTYQVTQTESDLPFDFVNEFFKILAGKFEILNRYGIKNSNIWFWLNHEYDQECNLEISPEDMERMADHDIPLCITCWKNDGGYIDLEAETTSKYIYKLQIRAEQVTPSEISLILGQKASRSIANTWVYEVTEMESDPAFYFVDEFFKILEGRFESLYQLGIKNSDITFWYLYEYDQQCNMEFNPKKMKRMGENGIKLCITCWERGDPPPGDEEDVPDDDSESSDYGQAA